MKYRRTYSARTNEKTIPCYEARLRKHILRVPSSIRECSGIVIFGRRIKSIAFTTDLCIVRNMDADAVLAVYPFTPSRSSSRRFCWRRTFPYLPAWAAGLHRARGPAPLPDTPSFRARRASL